MYYIAHITRSMWVGEVLGDVSVPLVVWRGEDEEMEVGEHIVVGKQGQNRKAWAHLTITSQSVQCFHAVENKVCRCIAKNTEAAISHPFFFSGPEVKDRRVPGLLPCQSHTILLHTIPRCTRILQMHVSNSCCRTNLSTSGSKVTFDFC